MNDEMVYAEIRDFLQEKILKGEGEIESETPLLAWGLLDSLGMVELISYMEKRFAVAIPSDAVVGENFRDAGSICALICDLLEGAGQPVSRG